MTGARLPPALDAGAPGMGERDMPNASPQEQRQYDDFVRKGLALLYSRQTFPATLQRLRASDDPIDGLASVIALVAMRLHDTAAKTGIHSYSQQELEGALYRAIDIYRETEQQQGGIDRQAAQQQWGQLMAGDQRLKAQGQPVAEPRPEGKRQPAERLHTKARGGLLTIGRLQVGA